MKIIPSIPSKSYAHRALICAALSETPCQVHFDGTSKDIEATKACLAALANGQTEMPCGESGSTLRFLLPVMGALGHRAAFLPEGRLPQRPLTPLYEEMERHGCKLSPQGSVPFVVEGKLQPGTYTVAGNVSSQFISGLLFALPLLEEDSQICIEGELESAAYVDMTLDVLRDFGVTVEQTNDGFVIPGRQAYGGPKTYAVEGDWSNGGFWLAAGAMMSEGVRVCGLKQDSLQGDRQILTLLERMGAEVTVFDHEVTVKGGSLHGITIDASQIPDMIPALAVCGAFAEGQTVITNAGRLRMKESDRLAAISHVLRQLGGQIEELPDGLVIQGGQPLTGGEIDSYQDHRIVMMAALASLCCSGKVVIHGADAVNKSYPAFFQILREAGLDAKVERK